MNKYFLDFLYKWPKTYISGIDLINYFDATPNARFSSIKRAVKEGYLIRLKKDFFLIKMHLEKTSLNFFEIAPLLYGPSHISFESALSFHGWIPEAVKTTTSACLKKSEEIATSLGVFSYKKIPDEVFSIGVREYKEKDCRIFIADPWKALCDCIYLQKKSFLNIKNLCDDLRIDRETLFTSNTDLLLDLKKYPSQRVKKTVQFLIKGLR